MNNFDLEELLNEALKPTELPSDILNAKLKQKMKKKKLYTGRRIFEISAVCAAACVAVIAVAINVNSNLSNKINELPIVSNIMRNDILIVNDNVGVKTAETVKDEEKDSEEVKEKAVQPQSRDIDNSSKINSKENKLENNTEQTVSAEPQEDIENKTKIVKTPENTDMLADETGSINSRAGIITEEAVEEDVAIAEQPMMAMYTDEMTEPRQKTSGGNGGGSSAANVAEKLPVAVEVDNIKTMTDEEGKKFSVDKNTNNRISVGVIFEEGYDYSTALYMEIVQQMNDKMSASEEVEYYLEGENGFNTVTGNEDFYVDSNNDLFITFDKGEIAPEEIGIIEFNVGEVEEIN